MDGSREDVLACLDFPREHWPQIASTNPLERVNLSRVLETGERQIAASVTVRFSAAAQSPITPGRSASQSPPVGAAARIAARVRSLAMV